MTPQNRYSSALAKKGKPLFVPFVVLGDPNREQSLQIIRTIIENGADALELGFPFSDPPADGPVIQAADLRALQSGIRINDCFEMLREIRTFTTIPIGLLVYYNLVLQRGTDKFYRDCDTSGVDSVLIADLPLEHASEVIPIAKKNRVAPVMLVSELTTDKRMEEISKVVEGYLYVVSYIGVTGVANGVMEEKMCGTIERARHFTGLPLIVGFGMNTTEQMKAAVRAGADGVIVGSRIVQEMPNRDRVGALCKEFGKALR